MTLMGIAICIPELLDPVVEGQDLRGADKREGQRVEEEDQIFSPVVGQLDLFHLTFDNGGAFPKWRRL